MPSSYKTLITGIRGVLGSALKEELTAAGWEVYGVDIVHRKEENYFYGDVASFKRMEDIFLEVKPEIVYHMAGEVSRESCEEVPENAIRSNIIGTMNIITLCRTHNCYMIHLATSEELGDAFDRHISIDENTPLGTPNGVYGMTKQTAFHLCKKYLKSGVIPRIFMAYGKEYPTGYRSAVTEMMWKFMQGKSASVHRGTSRNWCWINDIIKALALLGNEPRDKVEVYHIGSTEVTPTESLARKISEIVDGGSYEIIDPPAGITPHKWTDITKIKKDYGWEPETTLGTGLQKTYEWLRRLL